MFRKNNNYYPDPNFLFIEFKFYLKFHYFTSVSLVTFAQILAALKYVFFKKNT